MPIWGCIGTAKVGQSGPGNPDCGIQGTGGVSVPPLEAGQTAQAIIMGLLAGETFSNLPAGSSVSHIPPTGETF